MNRKFYLTDKIIANYNAGSKAVRDVEYILRFNGFRPLSYGCAGKQNFILCRLIAMWRLLCFYLKIRSGDTVFVQYPMSPLPKKEKKILYKLLSRGEQKLIVLIHDLPSIRHGLAKGESRIIWMADVLICHTSAMKDYLLTLGIQESKIRILNLFDYITDTENDYPTSFGTDILFAGNLAKSEFIRELISISDLQFRLYGLPIMSFAESSNVKYEGKFQPDDLTQIKGDWGLVWDGPKVDTCDGLYGRYLKLNSPHKLSLYLAARKPVIVWSYSALAEFVVSHNLGISVSSLHEISSKIHSLSDMEKRKMITAVTKYSDILRNGKMLTELVNS